MKKLIILHANILKKDFSKLFILLIIFVIFPNYTFAKEKWVIDKNISKISFELPVLFAKNVKGNFNNINGFVEIDLENKVNNKAFFTVKINSIDKDLVGKVASEIKMLKPVEPYKAKGIKERGQYVIRKEGKKK